MPDVFYASFTGNCGNCQLPIMKGDAVRYTSADLGTRMLVGDMCCGDLSFELPSMHLEYYPEDQQGWNHVPVTMVLPRRRTVQDMCRKCFQIPASNGVCGCD